MYPYFDNKRVQLHPLSTRHNDLQQGFIQPLSHYEGDIPQGLLDFAKAMRLAKERGAACVFLLGAHVLRSGVQRYIFDLMEHGYISGIAVNGAYAIHDFEVAYMGETTESVARYIIDGQFGLWDETGRINDIIAEGWQQNLGFGESLGKAIFESDYPFKMDSLFAKGYALGIPITVHVGIGYDIIHPHPNFNAAAVGEATYRDFLVFAQRLDTLQGGCVGTFGSAVMAPEVFLKTLSMVRNVAIQEGRKIDDFMSLVCDLHELPSDTVKESPKTNALYYFRPWKTLLARTVTCNGQSRYVQGRHEMTIPALWTALQDKNE